ncbi:MAG: SDR family NAD(P)-dependent oxidoreductase [Alphaproteobacteria bacterium]|nr:SDR family NAD(P)-dependent oxidoreductase [Alphaproteobacteria bacterium]
MKPPEHIVITGASSGLGAALALAYAAPGVRLSLCGRNTARLEQIAVEARAKGAMAVTATIDVTSRGAMQAWLLSLDTAQPVDLVIANAGISGGTAAGSESAQQVHEIMAINVDGMLNTVQPLLGAMTARGRGQIAIMASLAGFRGFPGSPAYCASKAAAKVYGEGLRGDMAYKGVGVSVICPGYVKTPMTNGNKFPMPFLMTAERAAGIIKRGLARNKPRIAFPFTMYFLVWFLALLPPALTDGMLAFLPKKANR